MTEVYDLFVIGGGINGAGIARDAAGRGLKVCLADKGEIGGATSSWSTKLIHGGLRYLENYDFKLVRESLKEREIIYRIANDITEPIPFIIPHSKNLRPAWLIRFGLFIYDNLGGKSTIPKSQSINIQKEYPNILKSEYSKGFKYYDLQVDDKKLTQLNATDARAKGATILEDIKVTGVERNKSEWLVHLGSGKSVTSKILINASGPWVNEVTNNILKIKTKKSIRLVKGSHIIVKKMYNEKIAFTLQTNDKRIVFVIPYNKDFSLIGTTEVDVINPEKPMIDEEEINYLISSVNKFFSKEIKVSDIIETYSGIRPLIEDFKDASKVTRDYAFDLNCENDLAPLLNIYGGKLTTYRKLAEKVLDELSDYIPKHARKKWTSLSNLVN